MSRDFKEDALKGVGAVVGGMALNYVNKSQMATDKSYVKPLAILAGIAGGLWASEMQSDYIPELGEGLAWGCAGKGLGDWLYDKTKKTTQTTSFQARYPVSAPVRYPVGAPVRYDTTPVVSLPAAGRTISAGRSTGVVEI